MIVGAPFLFNALRIRGRWIVYYVKHFEQQAKHDSYLTRIVTVVPNSRIIFVMVKESV